MSLNQRAGMLEASDMHRKAFHATAVHEIEMAVCERTADPGEPVNLTYRARPAQLRKATAQMKSRPQSIDFDAWLWRPQQPNRLMHARTKKGAHAMVPHPRRNCLPVYLRLILLANLCQVVQLA